VRTNLKSAAMVWVLVASTIVFTSGLAALNPDESALPAAPSKSGLGIRLGNTLIGFYQNRISGQSIRRCPYYISCSNYARIAIEEHGLLIGSLYFIDRNVYRENPGIWQNYPLSDAGERGLKLDDFFYLRGSPSEQRNLDVGRLEEPEGPKGNRFADVLMRDGDYERAITEYKRWMFESPSDSTEVLLRIASAHRRGGNYNQAINFASSALLRGDLTNTQTAHAHMTLGLGYMGLRLTPMASDQFRELAAMDTSGIGDMCLGWVDADQGRWNASSRRFQSVASLSPIEELRRAAQTASTLSSSGTYLPRKSPGMAAGLSLVIPGAGQIYSTHGYDALQAFAMTSSMVLATYAAYRYESEPGRHLRFTFISGAITGMFHAANVLGAYRTAQYRNWHLRSDLLRQIRDLILPHTW
jgi:putative component of membrane protein insertase Oxa1/YidC/SpoIIIJ protein YidD